MAFSSWRTWVTGEVVTAAHMNQEIRDNGDALFPNENAGVAWSPTLEGTSADATATVTGRQYRIGALQFVWARFVIGSNGGGGVYFVTLPVAASGITASSSVGSGQAIGAWQARDDSNPGNNVGGTVMLSASDKVRFNRSTGGVVNRDGPPFSFFNGDILSFHAVYPVA